MGKTKTVMKKTKAKAEVPILDKGMINLNFGSMVVNIKKLKRKSSFDISRPSGSAGIRG